MKQRFMLVQDNDCHWYVIPANRRDAFYDWVRSQELGTQMITDLEPARVQGPHTVTFTEWQESI